jgi:hypothetical protein
MFDGRPSFTEGVELRYYVWHDGENWRVRWTTMGNQRRFHGTVVAEGGELKSLKRIDVEQEVRVLYPGRPARTWVGPRGGVHVRPGRGPVVATRDEDKVEKVGDDRIVFSARTRDDIDGFDFKADQAVTRLRFVLEIDGRVFPNLVEVGKDNRRPGNLPFVVRLQ